MCWTRSAANIRVDARGPEVLRILPRLNEDVNEEWLGDKSRFALDGLKTPAARPAWVRRDGKLQPATWHEAFAAIAAKAAAAWPANASAPSPAICAMPKACWR